MAGAVTFASLDFGVNTSARWTVVLDYQVGLVGTIAALTCPNGINVRKSTDVPSATASTINCVAGDVLIFNKTEEDVLEGSVYLSYAGNS